MIALALLGAAFALSSPAFRPGAAIPARYTCAGADVSPPLRWTAPPRGTRALALTLQDPDAPGGTFTHWVAWGISPRARRLPAGARLAREGRNSFGRVGYGGPCPPRGPAHRYLFRLYALDRSPRLRAGADLRALVRAVRGHVLAVALLVGASGR